MASSQQSNFAVQVMVLLMGLFILIPFAYKFYTYCAFRYHAVTTQGVIADPLQGGDWGGRPYVEYQTPEGRTFGFKTKAKTHWFFAPGKGEKVGVFYLEADPKTAIVDSLFHYIILPLALCALGAALVMGALKNMRDGEGRPCRQFTSKVSL